LISDSAASQHEAEERAETLAKCNKHLEKELQDVDQMALAVEAECSSTVKESLNLLEPSGHVKACNWIAL
jgi:centrosomal protein CEP135